MAKGKAAEIKKNQISLDVDAYIRTRDSLDIDGDYLAQQTLIWEKVVTGLATLQDAIQTLSRAYIKHTNAVLGDHAASSEIDSSLSKLGDNPALLGDLTNAPSPGATVKPFPTTAPAEPATNGKPERKKRPHDPLAPKRPLTPFFLYMQTARPIIASDLGPTFAKGEVSNEGTRRWATMSLVDKQLWSNAYQDNLRLYNGRVHAYRNGNLEAKEMPDQDAALYCEEHNIGVDATADGQLVGEANILHEEDADGEPEKEPTPVVAPKTPKAKSARKSKTAKETPVAEADAIVPTPSIVPAPAPEPEKTPDKKRKRVTKKSLEAAAAPEEQAEPPKSAPKSSRKKKTKTDA
ncbi:putative high mobility group protein 1 [Amylocarpus encephaloides]|uniref:High mobility group protein 1 n=1 Tax=Amylocarpus encephaloides TaxID=45428 RepID=A0A9P8C6P8_9HELO|nr:putative high mobility group protein 1 [Amylocarpus encephaloides]